MHAFPFNHLHGIWSGHPYLLTIDIKCDIADIGKAGYIYAHCIGANHPRTAKMQNLIRAPVSLIEPKRILARFMVAADKTFIVDSVMIAFRAVIGGRIEHHPREGPPHAGITLHLAIGGDMVARLIFLGVETRGSARTLHRVGVVIYRRPGTVFAHRHRFAA